jgi:endoglucanase
LDRNFVSLLNDLCTCKAFDNRAGVALLIDAMRQISEMDVEATIYAVGTVQEEVGLKGARTAAFGLYPDVAIATDVTIPGDHPGIEKKDSALEIGKGPVITVVDGGGRGLMADPGVVRWLSETAEEYGIPYQLDVGDGGTTDATAIHLTKEGIPSSTISVPARYIHSPVEVMSIEDLKACSTLIAKAAVNVGKYF